MFFYMVIFYTSSILHGEIEFLAQKFI